MARRRPCFLGVPSLPRFALLIHEGVGLPTLQNRRSCAKGVCAIGETRRSGNAMIRTCIFGAFALALSAPAVAEPAPKDIATRTEVYPIQTLTLSDKQFLTGDHEAKAATTSGLLRLPAGTGRLPVVVLMHGSGGMGANIELW